MRAAVVERLREACARDALDAVVATSPENVAYVAGFVVPSQPLMRWRHVAAVVTADGQEAIVCVDMEESTVRAAAPNARIGVWAEFSGSPWVTLASVLTELGVAGGRVGVELKHLSVIDHAEVAGCLPTTHLVAADRLLARARQVKSAAELELLGRLARVADGAIGEALASVKAGDSEMDIAAVLTRGVYERGAEQFKLLIVASGERSQLPNVGPSPRVLTAGDVCRVEVFAVSDGYHAGVCRTAVVGEASAHARRVYRNLSECKRIVLDALVPGASAADVYGKFRTKFDELEVPPIAFVGHGIGTSLHEDPYLRGGAAEVIEAGMVLGIEPLVYRSGYGFGMQIKDMVAVGEHGAQLLSDVTGTGSLLQVEA